MRYYYITRDVQHIMNRWCETNKYELPNPAVIDGCFTRLERCLSEIFKREHEIKLKETPGTMPLSTKLDPVTFDFIRGRIAKSRHLTTPDEMKRAFWISLDCVYTAEVGQEQDADFLLQITRIYDADGGDKIDIGARPQFPPANSKTLNSPIDRQIDLCVEAFERANAASKISKIFVVDDGLYSGGTLEKVIRKLWARGIQPTNIVSALARSDGFNHINSLAEELISERSRLDPNYNIVVDFGPTTKAAFLRDWVCERDFYFGVPHSGRTVGEPEYGVAKATVNDKQSSGIVYAVGSTNDLFGCASIGVGAFSLSRVAYKNSFDLWSHIEQINSPKIRADFGSDKIPLSMIPRLPYPLNVKNYPKNQSFTEWLADGLARLGGEQP